VEHVVYAATHSADTQQTYFDRLHASLFQKISLIVR
jgi:hypothetical protein